MKSIRKNKLIAIVSSILVIVSAWLPWIKVEGFSLNGFQGDIQGNPGIFFIVLGLLSAMPVFMNKKWAAILAIVLGIITGVLAIKYLRDVSIYGNVSHAGLGLYAMLAGSIGIIAGAMLELKAKKDIHSDK